MPSRAPAQGHRRRLPPSTKPSASESSPSASSSTTAVPTTSVPSSKIWPVITSLIYLLPTLPLLSLSLQAQTVPLRPIYGSYLSASPLLAPSLSMSPLTPLILLVPLLSAFFLPLDNLRKSVTGVAIVCVVALLAPLSGLAGKAFLQARVPTGAGYLALLGPDAGPVVAGAVATGYLQACVGATSIVAYLLHPLLQLSFPNRPRATRLVGAIIAWVLIALTRAKFSIKFPIGGELVWVEGTDALYETIVGGDESFEQRFTVLLACAGTQLAVVLFPSAPPPPPPSEVEVESSAEGDMIKKKKKDAKEAAVEPAPASDPTADITWSTLFRPLLPILPFLIPLIHLPFLLLPSSTSTSTILSSTRSLTGQIVVGEQVYPSSTPGQMAKFRYLRCDHSLLGGSWIVQDGQGKGGTLGEPIYGTFVLQEAAWLIERPSSSGVKAEALVIGLGIGTAPSTFAHRFNTRLTVLEIDPLVVSSAQEYFGFSAGSDGTVLTQDAVEYLKVEGGKIRATETGLKEGRFDYVLHDVFTGGSVPSSLFTFERWLDVRALLKPDGVVAVNFAGHARSRASRAVLATLYSAFDGACRAFDDGSAEDVEDFRNMVIFCIKPSFKSNLSGPSLITFRTPSSNELFSPTRQQILSDFVKNEFELTAFVGGPGAWDIREGDERKLDRWQTEGVRGHWKVMNNVLPWKTWLQY